MKIDYKNYYNTNERYYHNIFHIEHLLSEYHLHLNDFKDEFEEYNENDLITAIQWHDSYYEVGNKNNEFISGILYWNNVKQPNYKVFGIIESTKIGYKNFDSFEKRIMHDLDYSVFRDIELFKITSKQIRTEAIELGKYPEEVVIKNQILFYEQLLDKPLYLTKTYAKYNEIANNNLKIMISILKNEM
jgi:predicted metal-dependent HD superfamily phosphohydrolase